MISAAEVAIAGRSLVNADLAAKAADKTGCPFWLLCAVLEKETGGRNIYGHDRGGALSDPNGRNIEVTEDNFRTFHDLVFKQGKTSNGVGPMQLTYRGFFPAMEKLGLKPWLPAESILYGAGLVAGYWSGSKGTTDQRVKRVGRLYNGASAYGDRLVPIAAAWRKRLSAVADPPPAQPPVVEPKPENVGLWAVDPGQVQSVLLGRDASGKTGNALSPGTAIADGVQFVKNSVGKYALLRSNGWSYDRSFLVQVGVGPVPVSRQFPVIPDYDTTERIKFRGGLACRCVAVSLPWVEYALLEAGVIRFNVDIYQLGYRTDVEASAGTHARGGNTDVGQYTDAALRIWRAMGWTIQHRTTAQGFSGDHGHGWPNGCPHLSSGGQSQARSWKAGRDGLRQNRAITGPSPKGSATPRWDAALSAYMKKVGAPATN